MTLVIEFTREDLDDMIDDPTTEFYDSNENGTTYVTASGNYIHHDFNGDLHFISG